MPKKPPKPTAAPPKPRGLLARPLDSLLFLLPLILFYEIACLGVESMGDGLAAPKAERVIAFHLLMFFFDLLGTTGVMMPALAVIVILLATHLVSKEPWRFRPRSILWMYVESALWAVPLVFVSHLTLAALPDAAPDRWIFDSALCVGAGIYEELVFRLIAVSVIVMVGADLLRFRQTPTLVLAILIAAILFALHHHPPMGNDPFAAHRFLFRTLAGIYLGAVFVLRGYGAAAGTHIAYNLCTLFLAA